MDMYIFVFFFLASRGLGSGDHASGRSLGHFHSQNFTDSHNGDHGGNKKDMIAKGKKADRTFDDYVSVGSICYEMKFRGGWKSNSTKQGREGSVQECAEICASDDACKKFEAANGPHGIYCWTWKDSSAAGTKIAQVDGREQYAYVEVPADNCARARLKLQAAIIAIPSVCMGLGSLLALVLGQTSEHLMAALQNLGAGLILAAVGMELLPKLAAVKAGTEGTLAIAMGFSSGIGLMLLIKAATEEPEEAEGGEDAGKVEPIVATSSADNGVPKKRSSLIGKAMSAQRSEQDSKAQLSEKENLLQTEVASPANSAKIPWTMAFAVGVDSIMDGVLIGIILVASMHAGCIMAGATAIEMGFLGLTFTTTLQHVPAKYKLPISLAMPVLLQLGGIAGCVLAGFLENSPEVFGGVIAFGVAALLYLVTRELLLEAHEKEGETDLWYVNIWLFVGFLAVILGDRLTH